MIFLSASACFGHSFRGADIPWTGTYEAEDMTSTGTVLGPKDDPLPRRDGIIRPEVCEPVRPENSLSLPCNPARQRHRRALQFTGRAGRRRHQLHRQPLSKRENSLKKLPITSRYSWLYGKYPFTNNPKAGKPRNFYDEVRLKGLSIASGTMCCVCKRTKTDKAPYCIIDLVDLENVAPPLTAPLDSLSVTDFGAIGNGQSDDTAALRKCIVAAKKQGKGCLGLVLAHL